jgi:Ca2+-binding RTX toxin-like protein
MLGSRFITRLVGVAVFLLVLQIFTALPALGVTCSFDSNSHVATVDRAGTFGGTLVITRNGDNLTAAGITCGTVTTVDKVNINMAGGCCEALLISMTNGPLGPGFTDELNSTTDEIEFDVTNVGGVNQLGVFGTNGNEIFTAGARLLNQTFEFVQTMNLNGEVEGTSEDEDVIIHGIPEEMVMISNGGNDVLLANGTGTINSRPSAADVTFSDGGGGDAMVGGDGNDAQLAQTVPDAGDSFSGGPGSDTLDMSSRSLNMSITQNGAADDGAACPGPSCEGDNIGADVERIRTGSGHDNITAAAGDNELRAGQGNNVLDGGPGNDFLSAGNGTDVFTGGAGFDSVSYGANNFGVVVRIGDGPNDGSVGEQDDVKSDVEEIFGSLQGDDITGTSAPNNLFGGPGDDFLRGLGGKDLLDGGRNEFGPIFGGQDGSDTFFGGPGIDTATEADHVGNQMLPIDGLANDFVLGDGAQGIDNIRKDVENVIGGPGADQIKGSRKPNRITGGEGNDKLSGLGGNDRLLGQSGNDSMNGGNGTDACKQGPGSGPRRNCER